MNTEDEVLSPEQEDKLRRGLFLLAEETPAPGAAARRRMSRLQAVAVGAAAAFAAVLAGPALVDGLGGSGSSQEESAMSEPAGPVADEAGDAGPAPAGGDAMSKSARDGDAHEESADAPMDTFGAPAESAPVPQSPEAYAANAETTAGQRVAGYDLPKLVGESARIVVGKVSDVERGPASGASGGIPYVMATLEVEDTLRGPADPRIVAFDYVYGEDAVAAGAPQGATFAVGERVLVFLSDVSGTVHEGLQPRHWQVTGGGQGKFTMNGPEPQAPFTLDGVRAEIGRQRG